MSISFLLFKLLKNVSTIRGNDYHIPSEILGIVLESTERANLELLKKGATRISGKNIKIEERGSFNTCMVFFDKLTELYT